MNKKFALYTIMIILILQTATAIDTLTANPDTQQIRDTVIQENIKTRNELRQYTDTKIAEMINAVKIDGQKFIDDNFAILDKRIQEIATKTLIKMSVGLFVILIISQATWYAIRMSIENKRRKKTGLTNDELQLMRAGLITLDYKKKLDKDVSTNYYKENIPEFRETQPKPPSIQQVEAMIKLRRQAEEEKKIAEVAKKVEADKAKMQKIIDEKTAKINKKLEKKIGKDLEHMHKIEEQESKLRNIMQDLEKRKQQYMEQSRDLQDGSIRES